jgi:hypothetical protein
MSDQGFIGETEAHLRTVLDGRQPREVHEFASCEQSSCEDLKCDMQTVCAIVQ